jgi:type 1 glutamine amidotransferase
VCCKLTVNEFSCLPKYVSLTEFFCVLDVTIYGVLMVVTRRKGRGKVICVYTVKVHGGVEAQCPSFLIIVQDGGRWSASCSSHSTPLAKEHYPFSRRLRGLQSESGYFGVEKNLLPLPRFQP